MSAVDEGNEEGREVGDIDLINSLLINDAVHFEDLIIEGDVQEVDQIEVCLRVISHGTTTPDVTRGFKTS